MMRASRIFFTLLLVACGSTSSPGTASSDVAAMLGNDCDHPPSAAPLSLCFAGMDYVNSTPGAIYQVRPGGAAAALFRRKGEFLTSYAQAPDGTVYFTNAVNGMAVYKVDGAGESVVYRHGTYVRMVRVDSTGRVYFNESSGAGGDGTIYRLVNGVPEVFYRVSLGAVRGFWGDFGFDAKDRLWLSSSNVIPAQLYLVVDGIPKLVYTSRHTPFMGFRFTSPTQVLFAGQDETLRLLDLCSQTVSDVYTVPGSLQAQDVNVCPAF